MIDNATIDQIRAGKEVVVTVPNSTAVAFAKHCAKDKGYYTVTIADGKYWVRVYGYNANGLIGLWHLLTDEELAFIGQQFNYELKAHRFLPGGLIVGIADKVTAYAVAVAVLRYLGIDKADVRYV